MRVTSGILAERIAAGLGRTLASIERQQTKLATGRRITAPADDPAGTAQTMTLGSRQAAGAQFERNVAAARAALESSDAAIRAVVETFIRARELAIQGANDTNDALARAALGGQVDQLLEEVVATAVSRGPHGTMHFGGQEALTEPYAVARDASGRIVAVTPNPRGIDGATPVEVSDGVTVSTATSGTSVFGPQTATDYAFDVLIALRDDLEANDAPGVRGSLDALGAMVDRATLASTVAGSRLGWLATLEERLTDTAVVLGTTRSRLEDLDYVRAVEDLEQIQAVHQAGLASAARLLQQTLLDFLR